MKFGEMSIGGKLGGWEIVNAPADKLPQPLASATVKLFYGENGEVKYNPVWYAATQLVNGLNHMLVCEQFKKAEESEETEKHIVAVVVNIPAGDFKGEKATIVEVINDADLIEGTDPEMNLKGLFKRATQGLVGCKYTPVLFLGQQVVRGINYSILTEIRPSTLSGEPYPAVITINVISGNATVYRIDPLRRPDQGVENNVLGYAFTWR